MRDFHMTENAAMNYPLNRAFALMAFHTEHHPMCPGERDSDGYIAQEMERLRAVKRET